MKVTQEKQQLQQELEQLKSQVTGNMPDIVSILEGSDVLISQTRSTRSKSIEEEYFEVMGSTKSTCNILYRLLIIFTL